MIYFMFGFAVGGAFALCGWAWDIKWSGKEYGALLHDLSEQHKAELAALNESHEEELQALRSSLTPPRDGHGHSAKKVK